MALDGRRGCVFCTSVVLVFCFSIVHVKGAVDVRCTEDYCVQQTDNCPKEQDCTNGSGRLFKSTSTCNCCPDRCILYLNEGDECSQGMNGQPPSNSMCGPGLTCDAGVCKKYSDSLSTTKCATAQRNFDQRKEAGTTGILEERPSCDDDGDFSPLHCILDSICYCVNPFGDRIFGEMVRLQIDQNDQSHCQCAIDAWKADQKGLGPNFAHCLSNGKYDSLQCVDNLCACVGENGAPIGDKFFSVIQIGIDITCFNPELHTPMKYERPCEEMRSRVTAMIQEAKDEGVILVGVDVPRCTPDGRYARLQKTVQKFFCSDPDGNQIENFESPRSSPEAKAMDCNCARTRHTLRSYSGPNMLLSLPECTETGNYRKWQCWRGNCFCVDENGNQMTKEQDENNFDSTTCSDVTSTWAI